MPSDERHARMKRMRQVVREHNIYRWAAELISELSEIRLDTPEMAENSVTSDAGSIDILAGPQRSLRQIPAGSQWNPHPTSGARDSAAAEAARIAPRAAGSTYYGSN